jgi:AcrR family transcriptional regulator
MRLSGTRNRATPERRRAILDGALGVFLERGFEQATLEAICARLEVTKGSVYHHFRSKEESAVTLYAEAIEAIHTEVLGALAGVDSARVGVERLVGAYLRWFEREPARGAFVFRIMDGPSRDEAFEPIRRLQQAFVASTTGWLEPFVLRGEVIRLPPSLYVSLVIGPSRDFLRVWLVEREEEALRTALEVLPAAAWRCVASPTDGP